MSIRNVYIFYFPNIKEQLSNNYSPTYGRWCSESFREVGLFRSIKRLYEYLELENNNFYFGGNYRLINDLPQNEDLDNLTHEKVFKEAIPLSIRKFNKLMKLKYKKEGDTNLKKIRNRTKN